MTETKGRLKLLPLMPALVLVLGQVLALSPAEV